MLSMFSTMIIVCCLLGCYSRTTLRTNTNTISTGTICKPKSQTVAPVLPKETAIERNSLRRLDTTMKILYINSFNRKFRRLLVAGLASMSLIYTPTTHAIADVFDPQNTIIASPGLKSTLLGIQPNGLLQICPTNRFSGCVSSQDDRPYCFLPPWEYDGQWEDIKTKLVAYLRKMPGTAIISNDGDEDRYVHVEFVNSGGLVDDMEFYFTPNDDIIQFRSNRRSTGTTDSIGTDFGVNRKRLDSIQQALRFESIEVLRDRRQILFFFESPFDSFGPTTIEFEADMNSNSNSNSMMNSRIEKN